MRQGSPCAGKTLGWFVGLLVVVAATNAAGGEAAPVPAGPAVSPVVSGTRLRAMFHDGGGGALVFDGWFDSELGRPCAFMRTRNGQMRCLPVSTTVLQDSTCTMPVWRTPTWRAACDEAPPPRYVTAIGLQSAFASVVYELGEPYTGAVRTSGQYMCGAFIGSGGGPYYGTGAEIPSERFVAAAMRLVPIDGGRLVLRTVEGDDGSSRVGVDGLFRAWRAGALPPGTFAYVGSGRLRAPMYVGAQGQVVEPALGGDFYDAQADAPCHPERFADGERCVPLGLLEGRKAATYLETICTRPGDTQWAPVTERVE